jgi:hypothetical protein
LEDNTRNGQSKKLIQRTVNPLGNEQCGYPGGQRYPRAGRISKDEIKFFNGTKPVNLVLGLAAMTERPLLLSTT